MQKIHDPVNMVIEIANYNLCGFGTTDDYGLSISNQA